MTNIAQYAFTAQNKVTVLSDGSKLTSSDFDNKCKFKIFRFDQIKFLRKRIKSSFAHNFLKENKIDLIFFDSWKSIELLNFNTHACVLKFSNSIDFQLSKKIKSILFSFKKL